MAHTDKTRPYQVRLNDPAETEKYSYNDGRGYHEVLLNAGCPNAKCGCKADGYYDGKRATRRRKRHAKRQEIEDSQS